MKTGDRHFTKKGYIAVPAQDKNGNIKRMAIPVGGRLHQFIQRKNRQQQKQNRQMFRDFKKQMRQAKKAIPLEQRAKVNWSEVRTEVTEPQA